MSNQLKIGLILFIVTIVTVMVWLMGGSDVKNQNDPTTYVSDNWERKYKMNEKDPYGLFLFSSLLKSHIDSNQKIISVTDGKQLDDVLAKQNKITMLFVGNQFGLNNSEIDSILSKVEKGSDLFLSSTVLTNNINERLFEEHLLGYEYSDSVNVYIGNNRFTQFFLYQNDTLANQWRAFLELEPKDSIYTSLSYFYEMTNFVRIKHGKGFIFLHTNPEFFFNYQLKRSDGFRYASFAFNQLERDRDVYVLELGRLIDDYRSQETDEQEGKGGKTDDSYLQFLLKSPALIAAMGLSVLGLILFLIFRSKRIQPVVPFIPKKTNKTMEFAETISSIYIGKQYPYGILQVQRKNFLDTIHKHFFVDLTRKDSDREREILILSQKSNVPVDEIMVLLALLETKEVSKVDDNYIAEVSKKQRSFYEQTGVIQAKILQRINEFNFETKRGLMLSYLLIMLGIGIILYGLYSLVQAVGIGIVLWPVGALILAYGIIRMSKPLIKVENRILTHYPLFRKKVVYTLDDLVNISHLKNGAILKFTENRTLIISNWEMSSFDIAQFKLYLSKNQQFEL